MDYISLIKTKTKLLTKTEKKIADFITSGNIDIVNYSITLAAKKMGVSVSLISKFCNKIGFSGWKELKALAIGSLSRTRLSFHDEEYFESQLLIQMNYLNSRLDKIKRFSRKLKNDIKNAKRTILFAEGYTEELINMWSWKWQQIGFNLTALPFSLSSTNIDKNDHIIFVTVSGRKVDKIDRIFERGDASHNQVTYITLGGYPTHQFKNIFSLNSFNKLPAYERSYPILSDSIMLLLLNRIFFECFKDNPALNNAYEE